MDSRFTLRCVKLCKVRAANEKDTELNYTGGSQQFGPASKPSRFDGRLDGGVESLELWCRPDIPRQPHFARDSSSSMTLTNVSYGWAPDSTRPLM
jgi:hypothetical protein